MVDKKIVEMIESVERLSSWAGDKFIELSNRPLVVTSVSVVVASLISWKLAKCWNEDKIEEKPEGKVDVMIPKQSAAAAENVTEESLSVEDKWNKHTEEFCKKQRDPVNRMTRSPTKAQPIVTKKSPIRKTPRRPSPTKMLTMSPLRSTSPTKLASSSSKKSTP